MRYIRALSRVVSIGIVVTPARLRSQCQDPGNLSSETVASAFVAQLVQRRPYEEVIGGIGKTEARWPMVELTLTPLYGWKERPSIFPDAPASHQVRINVRPQEDPGFPIGTQVLVLMKRVYLEAIRVGDSVRKAQPIRTGSGMLVLASCGLRTLDSVKATLRALGDPQWRGSNR
jgi:hypothetical protein